MAPLDQIRIIEVGSSEAAGMCTLILSDFGAEVICVSQMAHNDSEETLPDHKVPFERICDRGKKKVCLDLDDAAQRELYRKLIKSADAVVDGSLPGEMKARGLGAEEMKELCPGLVYTQVTGYGMSGPYAEHSWSEATIQAESGFVSTTGAEGGEPVRCGGDIATFEGGMTACIATLMGLADRLAHGTGQIYDVSLMDAVLFGMENQFSLYLKSGIIPRPRGNHYALSAPVGNFRCGDGKEIMISVATETQWAAFAEAVEREDWLEREEFCNVSRRLANNEILTREVQQAFSRYSREELIDRLQQRSCIYGCINDFAAVASHPQPRARRMWLEAMDGNGEPYLVPDNPIMMDGEKFHRKTPCQWTTADSLL